MACSYEWDASLNTSDPSAVEVVLAAAALIQERSEPVVIGCSGGPDSVALVAVAAAARCDAHVVYVDHGLRPDRTTDIECVGVVAERSGFSHEVVEVAITDGGNLEARARDARLAALERVRSQRGAAAIWLAHTLDDQAETLLMAVVRGSGLAGLSGMAPTRGTVTRPLLGVRRDQLRAVVRELDLPTVDDPMNHDATFTRVWIRDTVLPLLQTRTDGDLAVVLARQAELVRDEHEYLERIATSVLVGAGLPLAVNALVDLDRVVLRRVVRQFVGEPRIGGRHVEAALAVVYGAATAVELPNRRTLRRSGGILTVTRTGSETE